MGARTKLNQAYLIGWTMIAAFVALAMGGSRQIGLGVFAILTIAGFLGGDLRTRPSRRDRLDR